MSEEYIRGMIERGRHWIPAHMWGGIERYLIKRIPPGGFLEAVFSNDLMGAFNQADDSNSEIMRDYCIFLYNFCPTGSYGSKENFNAWLNGSQDD